MKLLIIRFKVGALGGRSNYWLLYLFQAAVTQAGKFSTFAQFLYMYILLALCGIVM